MYKTLSRSSKKIAFGVCAGIADYVNVDPILIRLLFVLALFLGIGSPILVYIILACIMPKSYESGYYTKSSYTSA